MCRARPAILALMLGLTATPLCRAAPVIDQSFDPRLFEAPGNITFSHVSSSHDGIPEELAAVAQTFRVGITGNLHGLSLIVGEGYPEADLRPLIIEIRPTTADGAPVDNDDGALARVVVDPYGHPTLLDNLQCVFSGLCSDHDLDFAHFELDAPLPVTAGQLLAFSVRVPREVNRSGFYSLRSSSPGIADGYLAGARFVRSDTSFDLDRLGEWIDCVPGFACDELDLAFQTLVEPAPVPVQLPAAMVAGLAWLALRSRLAAQPATRPPTPHPAPGGCRS